MKEQQTMTRLLNRRTFAEAGQLAQAIAQASGHSVAVRRLADMFALWVAASASAAVYPVAQRIVEEARRADRHRFSGDDYDDFDDYDGFDEYQEEVRAELAAEINDDRQQYADAEEEGWFHPDTAD